MNKEDIENLLNGATIVKSEYSSNRYETVLTLELSSGNVIHIFIDDRASDKIYFEN